MPKPAHSSLHSLLTGSPYPLAPADGRDARMSPPGDSDFSYTMPAALDLLAEMGAPPTPVPSAGLGPDGLPPSGLRAELKAAARSRGQSLALDVVTLLMQQITGDRRLLAPVRAAIAETEPAYLRLALADPRFFSAKSHPARRLLDVLAARSLVYPDEQAAGFADFMQEVRQVTSSLAQAEQGCDAALFARVLTLFEDRQKRQRAASLHGHDQAVQVLLQAERRHLLAEKIAAALRTRPDFHMLPRVMAGFLVGPWAQVVAQEELLREQVPGNAGKRMFASLPPDLIWSLSPALSPQHRERLLRVIPEILATLREGLLFIDYPLLQSKPFFDALMAFHQQALNPVGSPPGRAPQAPVPARGGDFQPSEPWLAPTEAQQSGFLDVEISGDTQDVPSTPVPGTPGRADREAFDLVAQLTLGDWVELVRDGVTVRAQLTWASPHNTLFMFASAGGRTHSMTRRALDRLQQLGALKGIGEEGVVEGAFDSAARKVMRKVDGGR